MFTKWKKIMDELKHNDDPLSSTEQKKMERLIEQEKQNI